MRGFLWPSVKSVKGALFATRQAFWVMAYSVVFTTVVALTPVLRGKHGLSSWSLIDAGVAALVAVGLWRGSRLAAWLALFLHVWQRSWAWQRGIPTNLIVLALFTLAFISGVRGSMALHRLRTVEPQDN